jgi:hypothetical protein
MKLVHLTALTFIIISCNKQESVSCPIIEENHSNDVVISKDYIQAYPGSFWNFNNQYGLGCDGPTPVYIYESAGSENDCEKIIEDKIMAPDHQLFGLLDGKFQIITDTVENTTERIPVYDEELGLFYSKETYNMNEEPGYLKKHERSVIAMEDSIVLGDYTYYDIIKVNYKVTLTLENGNILTESKFYTLAKDIGIVRYEFPKETTDIYLTNYLIND